MLIFKEKNRVKTRTVLIETVLIETVLTEESLYYEISEPDICSLICDTIQYMEQGISLKSERNNP